MDERKTAEELVLSWDQLTFDDSSRKLTNFLVANSGIPGPRGNLTLAVEVSRLIAKDWASKKEFFRDIIVGWSKSGDEYLMFVANCAIGHVLSSNPGEEGWAVPILYEANFSPLWRAREGVTFALEALLEYRADLALMLINQWCKSSDPMLVRNSIVALAHPSQLRRNHAQLSALKKYNDIGMKIIAKTVDSKNDVKILAKSLSFTLSVAAEVDEDYLDEFQKWIDGNVKSWRTIIRGNLTKVRISKKYPARIKTLLRLLG
jgi:hypothetical protein